MKTILMLILFSYVQAAIPTMEGLFRNSASGAIDNETVVILLKAEISRVIEDEVQVLGKKPSTTKYYKYIIQNREGGSVIIARYGLSDMSKGSVESVNIYKSFEKAIAEEEGITRKILGSMILMFGRNSSTGFLSLLKSINPEFKSNEEVINSDKKELLLQYKDYLVKKKLYEENQKSEEQNPKTELLVDGESEENKMPISPMTPDEEDEKVRVQELVSSSMYTRTDYISLLKEENRFFWIINMPGIWAKFNNENHQLKHLKIFNNGDHDIITNDYVTYSGIYSVPKNFTIKSSKYLSNFDFINFYTIKTRKKQFSERVSDYVKIKKSIKNDVPVSLEGSSHPSSDFSKNDESSVNIPMINEQIEETILPINFDDILL